tara:strand:+ start:1111 stop:1803 length:693 start_codon:yes stop_codon:yes gene_type:complete
VLQELLSIFRGGDPLSKVADNFALMLNLTREMTYSAGQVYFGEEHEENAQDKIHKTDAEVNELERIIRRALTTHLSIPGNNADVPYSLLLMSLVKDVERLGDYAKNLSEIVEIGPDVLPEGQELDELKTIRQQVESSYQACANIVLSSRRGEATELIQTGRETARQCDRLVKTIGQSEYDAATTAAFILGTRFYKRINGHVLNVLSSVVMPLDQVDYYEAASEPQNTNET